MKPKLWSTGWDNLEPAPIEFLHSQIMELFHKWRQSKTDEVVVEIDGRQLNQLIAAAKKETYSKYAALDLKQPIKKSLLK